MSIVIKVLGVGCNKCVSAFENAKSAVEILGLDARVIKVEDIDEILKYGILMTPGLVINEEVIQTGTLLSVKDMQRILSAY